MTLKGEVRGSKIKGMSDSALYRKKKQNVIVELYSALFPG